jgi:hypothetical protein
MNRLYIIFIITGLAVSAALLGMSAWLACTGM